MVNWRMLFDCDTLGVVLKKGVPNPIPNPSPNPIPDPVPNPFPNPNQVLKKGDVLPGPGFKAAFGATSPDACDGDSGRGGVANALVEALRCEGAAEADFGVGTAKGRASPTPQEWKQLFANA